MTKEKCRKCGKVFEAAEPELDALCDDCAWEEWYERQLERSREFPDGEEAA
jgi:predicted  nucleic acid-binding Zn-ribbon protein